MVKKEKPKPGKKKGEQGLLLDVTPENRKKINRIAKKYKAIQHERLALTAEEVKLKTELKELIHNSGLVKLEDGSIKFSVDDWEIQLLPTEEKLTVTAKKQVEVEDD